MRRLLLLAAAWVLGSWVYAEIVWHYQPGRIWGEQ